MFGFGLKVGGGERYGFQRPRRKRFVAKMHFFRCEDAFFAAKMRDGFQRLPRRLLHVVADGLQASVAERVAPHSWDRSPQF